MTPNEERRQVRILLEEAANCLEKKQPIYMDHDLLRRAGMLLCSPAPDHEAIGAFAAYGQQMWLYPGANARMPMSGVLYTSPVQSLPRPPIYKASQIHPATDVVMVADLKRLGIIP